LKLILEGARLFESGEKFYILGLKGLRLSGAKTSWEDLSQALSQRSRLPLGLRMDENLIWLWVGKGRLKVELALEPRMAQEHMTVILREARVAGLVLPALRNIAWTKSLLPCAPYQPYALSVAPLRLSAGELRIADGQAPRSKL
jgi:hypothetical protein